MNKTGNIRRVDDLGRVVIPKEVRQTLEIHEGDSLEVYFDENTVMFCKCGAPKSVEVLLQKLIATAEEIKLNHLVKILQEITTEITTLKTDAKDSWDAAESDQYAARADALEWVLDRLMGKDTPRSWAHY